MTGGFVAYQTLIATAGYMFVTVLGDRDPRLVGEWRGVWTGALSHVDEVVLQADGSIHAKDEMDAYYFARGRWGTEHGVLYFKHLATDVWAGAEASYAVAPDRRSVKLSPRRNDQLPNQMTRLQQGAKAYSAPDRVGCHGQRDDTCPSPVLASEQEACPIHAAGFSVETDVSVQSDATPSMTADVEVRLVPFLPPHSHPNARS